MSQPPVKDSFLDLELHRMRGQEMVAKHRTILRHWQTNWVELEGLKEDVLALRKPVPSDLLRLVETYEGRIVTKIEIEDILGVKGKTGNARIPRTVDQVVNILDRRIDYVSQNAKTAEKQLEVQEEKQEKLAVVGQPDVRNEEGLEVMEIVEELDDEGNVVEGRVEAYGSSRGALEEVLKKAGINGLPRGEAEVIEESVTNEEQNLDQSKMETAASPTPEVSKATITNTVDSHSPGRQSVRPHQPPRSSNLKKSVSFTEVDEYEPVQPESDPDSERARNTQRQINDIAAVMDRAVELNKPIEDPVVPTNESEEDAKLRAEMLKYGMSDVQNIVAELEIEDESDFTDEGYDDEEEEDGDSLEDEDTYGRSTRAVIDDDIRAEMKALEEKLGIKSRVPLMQNVGPATKIKSEVLGDVEPKPPSITGDSTGKDGVKSSPVAKPSAEKASILAPLKKGVRFAEELDISPAPAVEPLVTIPSTIPSALPTKAPISDIVERAAPATATPASAPLPPDAQKKQSRFKSSRTAGPVSTPFIPPKPVFEATRTLTVPSGPPGKTIADSIVEKDIILGTATEPDEHDPALLQQQVATEYYKKRNLMIQKQGGFKGKEVEEERTGIIELTEEEGGKPKVSRFMAARLARQ